MVSVPPLRRTSTRGRFVGRAAELASLAQGLRSGSVSTIVGPPGVGKTRLAREAAAAERGRRDVIICDFSEARSDEEVLGVIVRGLSADVAGSSSLDDVRATIGRALSGKDGLLLVLDNFEHLTKFSGLVARAAELGPALLVTSREPLDLADEQVLPLEPLAFADHDGQNSDAKQLFLDCFRAHNPGHEPRPRELEIVTGWVQRLEGLPLSIVLVAASTKAPISEEQLQLSGEVQRSVEATIDASWSLLSPPEQATLAQCSMFRGGFDDSAAEAVVALSTAENVRDLLTRLARKSLLSIQYVGEQNLVERSPGDTDRPSLLGLRKRFTMLASIHEFAAAALSRTAESEESRVARELRYARLFAARAREAAEIEMGLDAREAKSFLEVDIDNLALAHKLAIEQHWAEPAVELALGIGLVTRGRTPLSRTLSLLDSALAAADETLDPRVAVRAWIGRTRVLELMGRAGEALTSARMAREIAEGLDPPGSFESIVSLDASARALLLLGRWKEARDVTLEVVKMFESRGMAAFAARARITLGDTWFYEDDLQEAEEAYSQALVSARIVGESGVLGLARLRKAIVDMDRGRADQARAGYESAIVAFRVAGDRGGEASATCYLAVLEHELGEFDIARARFETLVATTRELGKRRQQGMALVYLGALLVELGDLAAACDTLELAERILGELGVVSTEAYALGWRSVALAMGGDIEGSREAFLRCQTMLRAKKEQSFYAAAAALFEGHLDLALAHRAERSSDEVAARAHRAQARARLDAAPPAERMQSDVRIARRVLETALGLLKPLAPPAVKTSGERPLVIDKAGAWFRPADGERVDIETRAPLRKILLILADARLTKSGTPVPPADLMREVWQDTTDVAALQNRLRVGIATLRKLGLAKVLFTRPLGYLLDPEAAVLLSHDGKG